MEILKVRLVDNEQKSVQEIENELLKKHDEELNKEEQIPVAEEQQEPAEDKEDLREEDVLSYIGKRYNKQINSFDELMAERNKEEELPEDVAAYMKYKKETGRSFQDFQNLQEDFDSMDGDQLLKRYLSSTNDGLDDDDIDSLMEDYTYDNDIDEESKIKKVKIERKKKIAEAKKYFNSQKEKYKMPLESSMAGVSDSEKEEFQSYRQYIQEAKNAEEENNRKRQWFDKKTNEVFGGEFKGFEFNINDRKLVFSPADAAELKKAQASPMNFVSKFLDENGMMKDAAGYHRSLAMAMHPERFAKFFYEQGLADATEDVMRKTKNINMSDRKTPQVTKTTDGIQVRAVNPDHGRSLKIRSNKK